MKNLFFIVTAIATIEGVAINRVDACASHLPTFDLTGFPISQHQIAVLGSAKVAAPFVLCQ